MDFESLGKLIKDVSTLQKQQRTMLDRLEKLNEKADTVSEVVYNRIFSDYQHKLEQLNLELTPLYDQLKLKKAELTEAIQGVEEELKAYLVEKEEISVRAELGEFSQKKAASKIEALDKENEDKFDRKNKLSSELEKVNEVLELEENSVDLIENKPESPELPPENGAEPPEVAEVAEISETVEPSTLNEEVRTGDLLPPPPPLESVNDESEKTILDLSAEVQDGSTVLFRPPTLTIVSGSQTGTEFRLKMGVTNIGSGKDNDIRIDDPSIAEKHAQITFGPDGFTIYDYNTAGGILINGQRITERLIHSGDKIQIGDIKLQFEN